MGLSSKRVCNKNITSLFTKASLAFLIIFWHYLIIHIIFNPYLLSYWQECQNNNSYFVVVNIHVEFFLVWRSEWITIVSTGKLPNLNIPHQLFSQPCMKMFHNSCFDSWLLHNWCSFKLPLLITLKLTLLTSLFSLPLHTQLVLISRKLPLQTSLFLTSTHNWCL